MVRRPEGTLLDQRGIWRELVSDGVDAGDVEGFIHTRARQDTGKCSSQQGLPRPGGPIIKVLWTTDSSFFRDLG